MIRTIRARPANWPGDDLGDDLGDGPGSVLIAAIGSPSRLVQPGRTVREALREARVVLPGPQQALRVNGEEVTDLGRVLQKVDRVVIVNKVAAGGLGTDCKVAAVGGQPTGSRRAPWVGEDE